MGRNPQHRSSVLMCGACFPDDDQPWSMPWRDPSLPDDSDAAS